MRLREVRELYRYVKLRIPIRGYENPGAPFSGEIRIVTNPYKGL